MFFEIHKKISIRLQLLFDGEVKTMSLWRVNTQDNLKCIAEWEKVSTSIIEIYTNLIQGEKLPIKSKVTISFW